MKPHIVIGVLPGIILFSLTIAACAPTPNLPIQLITFTKNDVSVSIDLKHSSAKNYVLSATFIPSAGYHVYSKDLPRHGMNGIGRPTLLELTTASQMTALGSLTESVAAENFYFEHNEFLVYPLGAVTLSLPIQLPIGDLWVKDEVKITFMACSSTQCKPPVEGKIVSIHIPGADMLLDR
jgi:hypothetical protein